MHYKDLASVSDEQLQQWYFDLAIALKALNRVPCHTEDGQYSYPHADALAGAKAYLSSTVLIQQGELRRRGLPYGLKEIEEQIPRTLDVFALEVEGDCPNPQTALKSNS